jgi:hypothetical protein
MRTTTSSMDLPSPDLKPVELAYGPVEGVSIIKKRYMNLLPNGCSVHIVYEWPHKCLGCVQSGSSIDACCCIYDVKERE